MKEKPSLGYSLALYLSTVMWIVGPVGFIVLMGGDMYIQQKTIQWWDSIDEHDLSHKERRLTRADMVEERRQWREFYCPIDELPWLPVPLLLCCLMGGAGYRIRKGMGEPVAFADLLR